MESKKMEWINTYQFEESTRMCSSLFSIQILIG